MIIKADKFRPEDAEEAKMIILNEMNLAGIFNELPTSKKAPAYLQVAKIANIDPEKVVVLMGEKKEE